MARTLSMKAPLEQEDRATPYLGMIVALASWAMMEPLAKRRPGASDSGGGKHRPLTVDPTQADGPG